MYNIYYFFHIAGLSVWLGSLVALGLLLWMLRNRVSGDDGKLVQSAVGLVKWVSNPSAFIVLITGIVMIMKMGLMGQEKPFWMSFMEQTGGMVILLSVILLTIQSRRIVKHLTGRNPKADKSLSSYLVMIGATVLLTLVVIFVVSLKGA